MASEAVPASIYDALLDHLPKDLIIPRYQVAAGKELASGKFASAESSAALAANAFGIFMDRPEWLSLPSPALAAGLAMSVELEAQMRFPWSGGLHPWLDVGVTTADHLIGIESKRYEPFRDRKNVAFSSAYARAVWGDAMEPFEAMRDALQNGRAFQFLDAAQLVKHAFGLRTQAAKRGLRATLCYLHAEPSAYPDGRPIPPADIARHRDEIAAFSSDVNSTESDVRFCSMTYAELIRHWSETPALSAHASALAKRFDV
jgi:hypothetical protein